MVVLSLQHEEILAEKVKGFPVMSKIKVLKEKKDCSNRLGESGRKFRFCRNCFFLEQTENENLLKIFEYLQAPVGTSSS